MKRACTEEQVNIRKEEIINTVSKMFDEMDYQNISMKTISEKKNEQEEKKCKQSKRYKSWFKSCFLNYVFNN